MNGSVTDGVIDATSPRREAMRSHDNHFPSPRTLGAGLAAATVALPLVVGALLPGRSDTLLPFALMLPFVTMGLLEAALQHDRHAH
jgi:hypothetical protein